MGCESRKERWDDVERNDRIRVKRSSGVSVEEHCGTGIERNSGMMGVVVR